MAQWRELSSHQYHMGSSSPRLHCRHSMWDESVVHCLPCLLWEVSSGYSSLPLSAKTNVSKFQTNMESEGHVLRVGRLISTLLVYLAALFSKSLLLIANTVWPNLYCSATGAKCSMQTGHEWVWPNSVRDSDSDELIRKKFSKKLTALID